MEEQEGADDEFPGKCGKPEGATEFPANVFLFRNDLFAVIYIYIYIYASFICLKDVVKDVVILGVLSERRRIVKNK